MVNASLNWASIVGIVLAVCGCLLYTSDAADDFTSVDLGGRRIIKKKFLEKECGQC